MVNNPELSIAQLDQLRQRGWRPVVVGCLVNDHKLLLVYKKEYDLWFLPQGGIDNKESARQALDRELKEELGVDFCQQLASEQFILLGEAKVEFPTRTKDSRELISDQGHKILMKGKKYFFYLVPASQPIINLPQSEFNDYQWLTSEKAIELCQKIYQLGKKRITLKAIKLLKQSQFIN